MEIEGAGFEAGLEIARLESCTPSNGSESGSSTVFGLGEALAAELGAQGRTDLRGQQMCPNRAPNVCQTRAKCVLNVC